MCGLVIEDSHAHLSSLALAQRRIPSSSAPAPIAQRGCQPLGPPSPSAEGPTTPYAAILKAPYSKTP